MQLKSMQNLYLGFKKKHHLRMKENHQISLLVHCYLIKEKKQKQKVREKKKIMCICARFSGPDPAMSPPNPAPGSAASDAAAPPHIIITKKKNHIPISSIHPSKLGPNGQYSNHKINNPNCSKVRSTTVQDAERLYNARQVILAPFSTYHPQITPKIGPDLFSLGFD